MKAAGKKVKSTDMVFIDLRMATNIGGFLRMVNFMAEDGTRNQMGLAMVWNLRTKN